MAGPEPSINHNFDTCNTCGYLWGSIPFVFAIFFLCVYPIDVGTN